MYTSGTSCTYLSFYIKGITDPIDYGRYPSEAVQLKWIRYYLEEVARIKSQLLPTYIHVYTYCHTQLYIE